VKITAKSDYAIRAAARLAEADGARVKAEELSISAGVPRQFLENILSELRRAGVVRAQRGSEGGYELARPARDIDLGTILAAVGSPLAEENHRPGAPGTLEPLDDVWLALSGSTREFLRRVTLADIVDGSLPEDIRALAREHRGQESSSTA
jgi:Rrf2 family protein